MSQRYKRYSKAQLREEEKQLRQKLDRAKEAGQRNYIAIYNRKIEIVRSYMLDQTAFKEGEIWKLKEDPDHDFKIDEMSGVVAWGYRVDKVNHRIAGEREAILIDLLGDQAAGN